MRGSDARSGRRHTSVPLLASCLPFSKLPFDVEVYTRHWCSHRGCCHLLEATSCCHHRIHHLSRTSEGDGRQTFDNVPDIPRYPHTHSPLLFPRFRIRSLTAKVRARVITERWCRCGELGRGTRSSWAGNSAWWRHSIIPAKISLCRSNDLTRLGCPIVTQLAAFSQRRREPQHFHMGKDREVMKRG